MSEINQLKLEKLHAHYQKTKSFDDAANILKVSSEPIIKQYIDAVKAKYPDLYEDSEASAEEEDDGLGEAPSKDLPEEKKDLPEEKKDLPEEKKDLPEEKKVSKDAEKKVSKDAEKKVSRDAEKTSLLEPKTFWLKGADGTAVELNLARETPTKFILSEKPVEVPAGE